MNEIENLIFSIDSALSTVNHSLSSYSIASDIYEFYIFTLIIEAARSEGAIINYENVDGSICTNFVFRTSPGYIFSNRHLYSHAIISFPGKSLLEVHVGIRAAGTSEVLHECDVAVIEKEEADACRQQRTPPRSNKIIISVECKFYGTQLQLSLGREFLGLSTDFKSKDLFFVSNTSSETIEKLLTKRDRDWAHNILPSNITEVTRFKNVLQDAFKKYKAS